MHNTELVAVSEAAPDHPGSENTIESRLRVIWKNLLHLDEILAEDDFFEIGGDSLAAIRLLDQIEREFGEEVLEPDTVYMSRTFRDLEMALRQALMQRLVSHEIENA